MSFAALVKQLLLFIEPEGLTNDPSDPRPPGHAATQFLFCDLHITELLSPFSHPGVEMVSIESISPSLKLHTARAKPVLSQRPWFFVVSEVSTSGRQEDLEYWLVLQRVKMGIPLSPGGCSSPNVHGILPCLSHHLTPLPWPFSQFLPGMLSCALVLGLG